MIIVSVDTVLPFQKTQLDIDREEQDLVNFEALEYLKNTDWYVLRFSETGVLIPDDILNLRSSARLSIVHA